MRRRAPAPRRPVRPSAGAPRPARVRHHAAAAAALALAVLSLAAPLPAAGQATADQAARDPAAGDRETAAPATGAAVPFRRPPPEVLAARRSRLLDSLGTGAVVLRSADPRETESADPQASGFWQDDDFFYLTGLETPHAWLLLARRADGGEVRRLWVPERDPEEERWTGARPGLEEAARLSGVEDVRPSAVFERAAREGEIASLVGSAPLLLPGAGGPATPETLQALAAGAAGPVMDAGPLMAGLRLVKDDFELSVLRRAVEITDAGLRAAMAAARPGMYEYELEALLEYEFHRRGAERVGFPSIVGSGPNSVVLHYDENRRRMASGDLVVVDVGAEYSYYTADVTRTLPVSGRFTERQRALYRLVLGAQRAGIAAVKPGATLADVDRAARSYLREHAGDLCGEVSCARRFVHGVGHWLGLEVHDVGSVRTPFRPGMVLTVEPGVYLPEEGLGIRIEDDVLVTADGREVLSRAPRTAEEVEAAMAGEAAAPEAEGPARP